MAAMRGDTGRRLLRCTAVLVLSAVLGSSACQEYGLDEILYTDVFEQGSDEDSVVDLLWVVDNSGTMSEEQQRLTQSLGGLMALLADTLADYRLGVITTDVDDPEQRGRLQGEPPVLGPDDADVAGAFVANAHVGTQGSRDERGFEALELALTEAVDDGSNAGFFRPDARLHAVVVSDEDDHSDGGVEQLLSDLAVDVPDAASFTVHAIVGDLPDGCLAPDAVADAGPRYLEAARRTDGLSGSICLGDWTALLESIGLAALGLQDTFPLSHEPDQSTLEVRVDGVLIPERAEDGWTYDAGQNAVVLHGGAVPRPEMQVVITYYLLM